MNAPGRIPRMILFFCLCCGTAALMAPDGVNAAVDNTLYAELLGKYVKNGVVNYQGFKEEEDKLDRYLQILEETDTREPFSQRAVRLLHQCL